jgi:hypothetical protein
MGEERFSEYFLEAGVGWRMVNGVLESRGPEAFVTVVDTARSTLHEAKLSTARQEIHVNREGSPRTGLRWSGIETAGSSSSITNHSRRRTGGRETATNPHPREAHCL